MAEPELQTIVIRDRLAGDTEITGYVIGEISTRMGAPSQGYQRPKVRWGVNRVIKLESGGYVLIREAFSVIYHTRNTRCLTANRIQRGEPTSYRELPDDAKPCFECNPPWPEDLLDDEAIRFEFPRRSIDRCDDAAAVILELTTSRKYSGVRSQEVPEPVRALLAQCRENDPEFETTRPVQKIS